MTRFMCFGWGGGFDAGQVFGGADVVPVSVVNQGAKPAVLFGPIHQGQEGEGAVGRVREESRMGDSQTGKSVFA